VPHSVYALQYHLVQVVKYQKKVLEDGGVVEEMGVSGGGSSEFGVRQLPT